MKNKDLQSIDDYLAKTEADHDRAALIFAFAAFTIPFMLVSFGVFAWLLFF